MKTVLLAIALIVVSCATSSSKNIKFTNPICGDDTCTNQFYDTTEVFYLDNFPSCPITVNYFWRICNGEMQFSVQHVGYNPNDTNCHDFVDWILDASYRYEHDKQLYNKLYKQIAKRWFTSEYNALPPALKYTAQCPNHFRKYSYQLVYCTKYCGYADTTNYTEYIVQIACNNNACCRIEYQICWNTNTQQMDITETKTTTGTATCVTVPPTIVVCPSTYTLSASVTGGSPRIIQSSGYSTNCGITCE